MAKGGLGAHPGFAALVKSGVPAGALANASRNASPAAKKANPKLKRVKGGRTGGMKKSTSKGETGESKMSGERGMAKRTSAPRYGAR